MSLSAVAIGVSVGLHPAALVDVGFVGVMVVYGGMLLGLLVGAGVNLVVGSIRRSGHRIK
jgi:hypothetical protein